MAVAEDTHRARDLESHRIKKAELVGAVAEDQGLAIGGEAPAFAGVGEFFFEGERGEVVDEALLVFPSELVNFSAEHGHALGEVFGGDAHVMEDATGGQLHATEGGFAVEAGAFEEVTVEEDEPLRERCGVVRKGVDDFVGRRDQGSRRARHPGRLRVATGRPREADTEQTNGQRSRGRFHAENYSFGISLSVFTTRTGVLVFIQTSASLRNLAGTASMASPTVFTGSSWPFLVVL